MITSEVKRGFKAKAHALKPVILLGYQGLTEAVLKEITIALHHHELLKIKLPQVDRKVRQEIIVGILEHTKADLVQSIGRIATIYKEKEHDLSTSSTKASPKNKGASKSRSRN